MVITTGLKEVCSVIVSMNHCAKRETCLRMYLPTQVDSSKNMLLDAWFASEYLLSVCTAAEQPADNAEITSQP
jgi:hypothetical protein